MSTPYLTPCRRKVHVGVFELSNDDMMRTMATVTDPTDGMLDRRRFNGVMGVGVFAALFGVRSLPTDNDAEGEVVDGVVQLDVRPGNAPVEILRELDAETFVLAGVTWDPGSAAPQMVQARVRFGDTWQGWSAVEIDADGPDADGPEDPRPGTAPVIAPGAEAVEVRVFPAAGEGLPEGLRVEVVGDVPLDGDGATATITNAAYSAPIATAASRPTIKSRASWGADESIRRNRGNVQYGTVLGAFVHHTAGSNSYSYAEVPAIIRGIYRYHVVSRRFYDIGYNLLVDRFGRIWEGAYGGLDRAVVAAHTQYYNSSSFGISAIGTYSSKSVESKVRIALANAIAWKFTVHGIDDAEGVSMYRGSNARTQNTIAGHRNTKSTACPGDRLYAELPIIRQWVQRKVTTQSTLTMSAPSSVTYGQRTTLQVSWKAGSAGLTGRVNLQRRRGNRWEHVRQFAVSGGRGSTVITPGASNKYRLRASTCTRSDVDLSHPAGTSNTVSIEVDQGSGDPTLSMSGPSRVSYGERTTLSVNWYSGSGRPVTGRVNLQRKTGPSWEHVRQFGVSNGRGSTVITPGSSNSYRLRASVVDTPSGVSTAHPEGTSNTVSIRVD
jgi:hypothetical protein